MNRKRSNRIISPDPFLTFLAAFLFVSNANSADEWEAADVWAANV